MVELSKIKPGDEVLVRAVVDRCATAIRVKVLGADCSGWVNPTDIVSHTPKSFAVGDRVKVRYSGGVGHIRALLGQRAWVDLVDDPAELLNGATYGLSWLERADD